MVSIIQVGEHGVQSYLLAADLIFNLPNSTKMRRQALAALLSHALLVVFELLKHYARDNEPEHF